MSLPPMLMFVSVNRPEQKPINVWLPLFLLWPLVAVLLAVPLVLIALVDVLLWVAGQKYHHYSVLVVRALALLGDTRGMVIRTTDGKASVDVTVV